MKVGVGPLNGPAVADSGENARNPMGVRMRHPVGQYATGRHMAMLSSTEVSPHITWHNFEVPFGAYPSCQIILMTQQHLPRQLFYNFVFHHH